MEEIVKRLDAIERQNKEILSLLRTMKCAEQLEDAVNNLQRNLQPDLEPYLQPFTVLKVGKS